MSQVIANQTEVLRKFAANFTSLSGPELQKEAQRHIAISMDCSLTPNSRELSRQCVLICLHEIGHRIARSGDFMNRAEDRVINSDFAE